MSPAPNEIWMTKSGRLALVVEGANGELGFVWHDTDDNVLVFCPSILQLDRKTSYSISMWGTIIQNKIPETTTLNSLKPTETSEQKNKTKLEPSS